MKTATLPHRFANTPIVIAALIAALGGCASTGTHAPRTNQEAAAGAAVGTLGAAGGAVGGAAMGALMGVQCDIFAFICSPVLAIVYGVKGATAGGQAGARAGVNWSRGDAAPESPANATEPSAPQDVKPF